MKHNDPSQLAEPPDDAAVLGCGRKVNAFEIEAPETRALGSEGSRRKCRCSLSRRGKICLCSCCCCIATTAAALGVLAWLFAPQSPTFSLKSVSLENVSFPIISLDGLVPADTSSCPSTMPCGPGCSRCPSATDFNLGCLCQRGVGPVAADTSQCPIFDRITCGLLSNTPCGRCPDSSWILDGCFCRRPNQANMMETVRRILALLSGSPADQAAVIAMDVRGEVELYNPNRMGASVEPGVITLLFKDKAIGSAVIPPLDVGPRSNMTVPVKATIDRLTGPVSLELVQDLLVNNMTLRLNAQGRLRAKAWFISVTCSVSCAVSGNVLTLPANTDYQCTYRYS